MALTITVARGFTMTAGYAPTVADWNAGFLPTVTIAGGVDSGDIADDAVTFAKLNPNFILSGTTITALAVGDLLLVGDLSASDNRVITVANALNGIFSLAATAATAFTSYSADLFTFHNGTAAVTMTPARLAEQLMAQAPALTTTDDADEVLVHDASATDGAQATRVTLANLLPAKGTAGTYTGITGITTDAKGRVTEVSTTGSGVVVTTVDVSIPTTAGSSSTPFAHGFAAIPTDFSAFLECKTADAGYSVGDVVPHDLVLWFPGGGSNYNLPALLPVATTSNLTMVVAANAADLVITNKTTGAAATFTPGSWRIRWYARK